MITGARSRTKTINFPESWNELRAEQLPQLAAALIGIPDPEEQKIEIARILLSMHQKKFRKIQPAVLFESILPLCKWVTGNINLTRQLLPSLNIGKHVFHGPKDELLNLRLMEWDFAERSLSDWFDDNDKVMHLARLCAILYRPVKEGYDIERDPDGDSREPFNDNLINYHAILILKSLPINILFAIMLWYRGCRNKITDDFAPVFAGNPSGNSPKGESGYFDLMRAIAKEGTYGDFDKVEQMYLVNALMELESSKEEAEKIRLNQKKNNL
jgi:hypothetical protein